MAGKECPALTTFKPNSSWFNRYAEINYSIAEWYIAISRRLEACKIFDHYFRPEGKGGTAKFPMLGHAGNGKYCQDEFLSTLGKKLDDRVYQAHVLLQPYYRHGIITGDVANELRDKFSHSNDNLDELKKTIATLAFNFSGTSDKISTKGMYDLKLHETEKPKTQKFIDDLVLTITNFDSIVDSLKKEHSNYAILIDTTEQIKSGKILAIHPGDNDFLDLIIFNTSPTQHKNCEPPSKLHSPVADFTIFNIIQARRWEPEEHVDIVLKLFTDNGPLDLVKQLREKLIVEPTPDTFNNDCPDNLTERPVLHATLPTNLLLDNLKTYGWDKKKGDNSVPELIRAVCSVDLMLSEEELIYNFYLWLKKYYQESTKPPSKKNEDINTKDQNQLDKKKTTKSKQIEELEKKIRVLRKNNLCLMTTLVDFEKRNLLCYLDFTIISLLNDHSTTIDDNIKRNNKVYKQISDPTQKDIYSKLIRKAMDKKFLQELKSDALSDW